MVLVLLLTLLPAWRDAPAHPDLELQIERLTQEIAGQPRDVELLLRRGDLHRRHADWERAGEDLELARRLDPGHPLLDWYEGRLLAEAGQWAAAVRLLDRFLGAQPDHAAAYRVRAGARWRLNEPEAAARDFESAISHSERPAPGLYRSLVVAYVHTDASPRRAALAAVDRGLDRFPAEISLLGLGADIALAGGDPELASTYLEHLPAPLATLPQWAYRRALAACLAGDAEAAAIGFGSLASEPSRAGTWAVPGETLAALASAPAAGTCKQAAAGMLEGLQP